VGWNNECAFIELYKAKPVPWDRTHPKYYNKHTKYDAWEELAKAVGFWNNLADCLVILERYCRVEYKLPIARNHNVTASLFSTGIAALYMVSFAIFRLIKLIRNSKSARAMQVKFLYCPLNSWSLKSTNRCTPLYTAAFATNVLLFISCSLTKCGV
jgi:hypothetical protein